MALSDQLRQQILLELEARGADAASLLAQSLDEVGEAYQRTIDSFNKGEKTATQVATTFGKLVGLQERLTRLQEAGAAANDRFAGSSEKVDVGLNRLIADSLKYVDVLRGQADAQAEIDRMAEGSAKRGRIEALAREERAIEEVRAQIDRTTDSLQKEATATAWMNRQSAELDTALKGLAADERSAATATVAHTTAMADAAAHSQGYASAADMNAQANKRFAFAALNTSHALQDFTQSGLGAVINNIPLMTTSIVSAFPAVEGLTAAIGGPAGLAAAAMFGGVAVDLIHRNWETFAKYLGTEATPNIVASTDRIEKSLKAISEKTIKTQVDTSEIDRLTKSLEAAKEAKDAVEGLKNTKSRATQEAARRAKEAIVEFGGGDDYDSSVERVIRAAAGATRPADSPKVMEARDAFLKARKEADDFRDANGGRESLNLSSTARERERQLSAAKAADDARHQEEVTRRVGRAAEGYGADLGWLTNLVRSKPDAFANRGASPELLGGLEGAAPDRAAMALAMQGMKGGGAEKFAKDRARAQDEMAKKAKQASDRQARQARDADRDAVELNYRLAVEENNRLNAARKEADKPEKPARPIPGLEKRQAEMGYGQEFQSRARKEGVLVGGVDAEKAGRQIARDVANGSNVDAAMMRALQSIGAALREAQAREARQAQAWDQVGGMFNQFGQNQQRMRQRRPTLLRH